MATRRARKQRAVDGQRDLEAATRVDRLRRDTFLVAYATSANVAGAARAAGVPYGLARSWIEDALSPAPGDPGFAAGFALAERHACDNVEAEIERRAVAGTELPVVSGGQLVWQAFHKKTGEPLPVTTNRRGDQVVVDHDGVVVEAHLVTWRPLTIRQYSDRLLQLRAAALMPERYARITRDAADDAPAPGRQRGTLADLAKRVSLLRREDA